MNTPRSACGEDIPFDDDLALHRPDQLRVVHRAQGCEFGNQPAPLGNDNAFGFELVQYLETPIRR
jgi:hypothetical protein